MREYQIRPCSVLTFDEDTEKDLIKVVNNLKERKKLGTLITHLIRIALESPEVYGTRNELNSVLAKLDELGVTPCRYNYFNQLNKEVADIRRKVDAIYDMAYQTYMLAQFGKHIGLEQKSDNLLRTSFILERQVTDLCKTIGTDNINHTFASNKIEDVHERADKAMQFIIESYDNMIEELKGSFASSNVVMIPAGQVPAGVVNPISQGLNGDGSKTQQTTSDTSSNTIESSNSRGDADNDGVGEAEKQSQQTIKKLDPERANILKNMMKPKRDD